MNSHAYVSRNPQFNDAFEREMARDFKQQLRRGGTLRLRRRLWQFCKAMLEVVFHARRNTRN
jgi:hypothetical protein